MSKKRDNETKTRNQSNFENRGPSGQISRATVENRGITHETDATGGDNPVTSDMVRSNEEAIRKNRQS